MFKILFNINILFFISFACTAQEIKSGKYELCYNVWQQCDVSNILEIKPDSTFIFNYRNDIQNLTYYGHYKSFNDSLILASDVMMDTMNVSAFEIPNKPEGVNIIYLLGDIVKNKTYELTIFENGATTRLKTDSLYKAEYSGKSIDSISFSFRNRVFSVVPGSNEWPSIIKLRLNTKANDKHHQFGLAKILVEKDQLFVYSMNEAQPKKLYFRKTE